MIFFMWKVHLIGTKARISERKCTTRKGRYRISWRKWNICEITNGRCLENVFEDIGFIVNIRMGRCRDREELNKSLTNSLRQVYYLIKSVMIMNVQKRTHKKVFILIFFKESTIYSQTSLVWDYICFTSMHLLNKPISSLLTVHLFYYHEKVQSSAWSLLFAVYEPSFTSSSSLHQRAHHHEELQQVFAHFCSILLHQGSDHKTR